MPDTNLPHNTITKPTREQMLAATAAFLGNGGTREDLWNSANELQQLVRVCLATGKTINHRPGITPTMMAQVDDGDGSYHYIEELLSGNFGLSGEMTNGLASPYHFNPHKLTDATLDTALNNLQEAADCTSELVKHRPEVAKEIGIEKENSRAALTRCHDEIAQWLTVNRQTGLIAPERATILQKALGAYQKAVEKTRAYLDVLKAYRAPITTITPQQQALGGP